MLARRGGRPGLIGMAARTAVVAGTATAVSGRVQHRQAARYEEQAYQQQAAAAQQYAPPPPAPSAPQAATAESDVVCQLERLAALQQQGVLTPEEFAAQKARILNG